MTDHKRNHQIDLNAMFRTGDLTGRVGIEGSFGLISIWLVFVEAGMKDWLTMWGLHPRPSATKRAEEA